MTFLRDDVPGETAMHREHFLTVAVCSNGRFDFLERVVDAVHQHADMPFEIVVADDSGHRIDTLAALRRLSDRISRVVLNLGWNQGLGVNANQAIAAGRGRNVVFLSDDSLVQRPFMRQVWDVLESAPYVGVLYLGDSYNPDGDPDEWRAAARLRGYAHARTERGPRLMLRRDHGSSWACAFRRRYWVEVGGYDEADIYGDMPFINRGWRLGYVSATVEGAQAAYDIDIVETNRSRGSVQYAAHGALCHYPRLFGLAEDDRIRMGRNRTQQCSSRNHEGRAEPFNDFDCHAWQQHMVAACASGSLDLEAFASLPLRGRDELARDLEARP